MSSRQDSSPSTPETLGPFAPVVEAIAAAVAARLASPAPPALVSQRSVAAVVGMPAADYLADARAGAFASWKVRRLVFARTADVVAWLESNPVHVDVDVDQADDEASAFARIGARRVAP